MRVPKRFWARREKAKQIFWPHGQLSYGLQVQHRAEKKRARSVEPDVGFIEDAMEDIIDDGYGP